MSNWMFRRATDILLALIVMVVLLWYILTQPVFSFSLGASALDNIEKQAFVQSRQELLSIYASTDNVSDIFDATSDFLFDRLSKLGVAEQLDRGGGQRVIKMSLGTASENKLLITLHYVVLDHPLTEPLTATTALLELASQLSTKKETALQLELSIFLHRADDLLDSLINASLYQVEQMEQYNPETSTILLLMPGMNTPYAAYMGGQWRYLNLLMPSSRSELALYGRLDDTKSLRKLKKALNQQGLNSIASLSIPVHLPGVQPSPLKQYWDRGLPAFLMQTHMLLHDQDYRQHARFVKAFNALVETGY
ncbi:MAG: hypothetical protein CR991_06260 [Proteobacteria bacterium]|nr:MAG: hypothetical protein CR991_06260 [Pseudomonadota bacterium]